jgi:RND family efflux transporter MFP subunit
MMGTADAFVERPAVETGTAKPRRRRIVVAGIIVVLALLALAGLVPRLRLWHRLAVHAEAEKTSVPKVTTVHPERAPADVDVPLPGTTQPWLTTGIYARIDGYLKARYVDIGDHVKAGQLIAEIDAPEVDQQLNQARGTLAQSKASLVQLQADLDLARRTAKRFVGIGVGAVTQQEIDDRTTAATTSQKAVDAGEATVIANQAAVDRLQQLTGFERVYAPFTGVITARNVDPGSLISAGSTTTITQLFSLAQVDVLRIFVFAPQAYAFDVRVGQPANVVLREQPDRVFKGTVTRTADAIDPGSGTLLTEVDVQNHDGALLSGSYVTVHFKLHRDDPPLQIPGTALLAGAKGTRVAVIAEDGTLHYRSIELGRDYGDHIEVLSGLAPSDLIATVLPAGIADGAQVKAQEPPAAGQPATGQPAVQPAPPGKSS